jgi:hypothetical protein
MKSWIKSKTLWIGYAFQAVGIVIAVGTTIAGFLPDLLNVQIMGYIVILEAGIFQANRFFTNLGITFKKAKVTA